jgi:hypothetical protein
MSEWAIGLVLLAIAEVAAVFAIGHVDLDAVRVPCGVVTIGLAPGWLLLQRTRFNGPQLEQLGIGVLLSLAITALSTLVLFLTRIGVTPASTTVAVGGIIAALALPPWQSGGWVPLLARRDGLAAGLVAAVLVAGAIVAVTVAPSSPTAADAHLALGLRVERAPHGARRVDIDVLGRAGEGLDLIVSGTAGAPRRIRVPAGSSSWGTTLMQDRGEVEAGLTVTLARNGRTLRMATLHAARQAP